MIDGIPQERLEALVDEWSQDAQDAAKQGNVAFSIGVSCCTDELREVLEDHE